MHVKEIEGPGGAPDCIEVVHVVSPDCLDHYLGNLLLGFLKLLPVGLLALFATLSAEFGVGLYLICL